MIWGAPRYVTCWTLAGSVVADWCTRGDCVRQCLRPFRAAKAFRHSCMTLTGVHSPDVDQLACLTLGHTHPVTCSYIAYNGKQNTVLSESVCSMYVAACYVKWPCLSLCLKCHVRTMLQMQIALWSYAGSSALAILPGSGGSASLLHKRRRPFFPGTCVQRVFALRIKYITYASKQSTIGWNCFLERITYEACPSLTHAVGEGHTECNLTVMDAGKYP
jgi:hypothetical protein